MTSQKITAIVLAKNEEEILGKCLDSLGFVDLIIVIDNNSTDTTGSIAREYGATVIESKSTNFSELRELALKKITAGYVLYLDADEQISKKLQDEIQKTVYADEAFSAYRIPRQNFYLGDHPWPQIEKHVRLFKRSQLLGWYGELHESPDVKGEIGDLTEVMLHYTHRNLASMVEKTNVWSETEADLRLKAHHPRISWWRFPRVMSQAFYSSYITQKGYKAGTAGLLESTYQAFSIFITYAKLWELQQNKTQK